MTSVNTSGLNLDQITNELETKQEKDPAFLTVEEAAGYLRLSKSFLDKMRLTGEGPVFHRPGSRILYRRTDLDAWMASRRFSATSEYDEKS